MSIKKERNDKSDLSSERCDPASSKCLTEPTVPQKLSQRVRIIENRVCALFGIHIPEPLGGANRITGESRHTKM